LVVFLPMAVQAARTWIRREVTIEFQGRNASGRYSISRGTITVSTVFYGRKSTHVGGSTPASLARIMLRESGSMSAAQPMSASHRKRPNCHAATK
jgi:hypothetical protein